MRQFLDLPGTSGSTYRFRLWPQGDPHQPIAGNYVVVSEVEGRVQVLVIGSTNDLSKLKRPATGGPEEPAKHIYTRLNVARGTREAEHADLSASHPKATAGK